MGGSPRDEITVIAFIAWVVILVTGVICAVFPLVVIVVDDVWEIGLVPIGMAEFSVGLPNFIFFVPIQSPCLVVHVLEISI